ncbi:MAG: hypothetical protein D6781_04520 [Verrucomicrobia bacterium]|nr:MAG: hypothetical protein D6781_04520 [Verrucomicrobiota bacterium]
MHLRPAILSILLTTVPTASAVADLKPFVLPWDDASPTITSLAGWQPTPAGAEGWVSVTPEGHFEVGGRRIRFLGVNIGAENIFRDRATAEKVAARLAKFGVNSVRFHHMEAPWIAHPLLDYTTGNSRTISPQRLDELHAFIAALKSHGIYSNINLLVSRAFKVADGFPPELAQLD